MLQNCVFSHFHPYQKGKARQTPCHESLRVPDKAEAEAVEPERNDAVPVRRTQAISVGVPAPAAHHAVRPRRCALRSPCVS